jgi:UDP-glucose 4-epimerase
VREKRRNSYKTLVTGGAGFIGSHLVEMLLRDGCRVIILDNLTNGKVENVKSSLNDRNLALIKEDLKKPMKLIRAVENSEIIFHLAANPEVRIGETDPKVHFEENILTTFNLLEAIRRTKKPKIIVFTSTSTVYGEALQIPTKEDYGPLVPISLYGASKLACEALIASYVYTFDHRALILRLANIIGSRSTHGVIADFIRKIRADPTELEILGDGTQEKSYMYITDCISAIMQLSYKFIKSTEKIDIYNLGPRDKITVKKIADIVSREMRTPKIKYSFSGGVDGGRGWKGDVKYMQLAIDKLLESGWKPIYTSAQAVMFATKALMKQKL